MPYEFEASKRTIPREPGKDRRVKLTAQQKGEIQASVGVSQRELARLYGVSRRTIQFILDPAKRRENLERRSERGGSAAYYDRDEHRETAKRHRRHKQKLALRGDLDEPESYVD